MCHSDVTVNSLFAAYEPDAHGTPLDDVVVRRAETADLLDCGRLAARRQGGMPEVWAERFRLGEETRQLLFVALHAGRVVGYGRIAWLTPEASGGYGAPNGWYLSGCVVDEAVRRRGVGRALTQTRLDWAHARGDDVYYFANADNHASLDLHQQLGFIEIGRDFAINGVTFTGGQGVLCRASARVADVIDLAGRR